MEDNVRMDDPRRMIPRSYQTKMEKLALESNTIIFLPTGSGKTFVAIQVLKRLQKDVHPPFSQGGQRSFFLVNSVPLVTQQSKMISRQLDLVVKGYSSENRVDFWKSEDWQKELEDTQVIVLTAQILEDMLLHAYITLDRINLLIFDECHHAVDNHPMRNVMKLFEQVPIQKRPRVLGLTATLINKNIKEEKVGEAVRNLESTFNAKICTVDSLDEVIMHSTNPIETCLLYAEEKEHECIGKVIAVMESIRKLVKDLKIPQVSPATSKPSLGKLMIQPEKIPKMIRNMTESIERAFSDLGLYGGSLAILSYIVQCERLKLNVEFVAKYNLLQLAITHFTHARAIVEEILIKCKNPADRLLKYSTPKIRQLLQLLKEYSPESIQSDCTLRVNIHRKELCAIIFVKEKFTSKVVYKILDHASQYIPALQYLKSNYIIGSTINPYSVTREEFYKKKQNVLVLEKFRAKQINCIISTEVVEEGIDVPLCNLIVRLDPIISFRSYVQSKGRGRHETSIYAIFVNQKDERKFMEHYRLYQKIEEMLNRMLVGVSGKREIPSLTEQAAKYKEIVPPYIYKDARITVQSAISLLNKYCQSLHQDMFTSLTPEYYLIVDILNTKQVEIYLPMVCPLKDAIKGDVASNLEDAKKIAALKACIALHKAKELDDNLLPKNRNAEELDENVEQAFFSHWLPNDTVEGQPKPGTKKRKRVNYKKIPLCLSGSSANQRSDHQTYYIHLISITPHAESDLENCLIIQHLLSSSQGFLLLTAHPMPVLCPFTLYMASGQVTVDIKVNHEKKTFTHEEICSIKRFHMMVFLDVLEVMKKFTCHDTTHGDNYYFVAPTADGRSISWETIVKYQTIESVEKPADSMRQATSTDPEYYRHMVVTPWYRPLQKPRYIVTKVLGTTPVDEFSDNSYESYAAYYAHRYDLHLLGSKEQPLLEVQYLSGKMNCLLPRSVTLNSGVKSKKLRMNLEQQYRKFQSEELVPEFCIRFSFPGVLWLKATMLPSLLHRLTHILVAEELRREINSETGLGCVELPKGVQWSKLESDPHAVNLAQLDETESKKKCLEEKNDEPMEIEDTSQPSEVNLTNLSSLNVVFKEDTYKLAIDKLTKEYPWNPDIEPIDIERQFDKVSVADVECYHKFVNHKLFDEVTQPLKSIASTGAVLAEQIKSIRAIAPPPFRQIKKIAILSKSIEELGPQLCDVLEAITTCKSNDILNMERLETLGDSFLKFGVSLYLVHTFPRYNEGKLTFLKSKIVSNRNLYYAGVMRELPGRIKVDNFSAKESWIPPAFCVMRSLQKILIENQISPACIYFIEFNQKEMLSGKLEEESWKRIEEAVSNWEGRLEYSADMDAFVGRHEIQDKVVSDCVEALIGTYLNSGGIAAAYKMLTWFHIIPQKVVSHFSLNLLRPTSNLKDILSSKANTVYSQEKVQRNQIDFLLDHSVHRIESIIKYQFKDPSLLLEAMTHSSNSRNRVTGSYERLEFLGDAILDFLITCHIYEQGGRLTPGELTDLRSALVNNNTFACLVVRLGLHKYMQTSNTLLDQAINKFVELQENKSHVVDESVLFLLEEEDCQLAQYIEVPKALGDIFESLAGAIFLDCGDLSVVWEVFHSIMSGEIAMFMQKVPKNPTRLLIEQIHAVPRFLSSKVLANGTVMMPLKLSISGKSHQVYGFGKNKALAKRSACKIGLRLLGISSS